MPADPLQAALMDALVARPWILQPTMPRNDRQIFELGFTAGWDARASRTDDLRIAHATLEGALNGDPRALLAARAILTGGGQK